MEQDILDIELQSQHINDYMNGFESILSQYREGTLSSYGGMESYTIGTLKASGGSWDIHSGLENFITDGIKKFIKMIWGWLEAIWNFVTGKGSKNSDRTSPKEGCKIVKEQNETINRLDTLFILDKETIKDIILKPSENEQRYAQKLKVFSLPGSVLSPADSERRLKVEVAHALSKISKTNLNDNHRNDFLAYIKGENLSNIRKARVKTIVKEAKNRVNDDFSRIITVIGERVEKCINANKVIEEEHFKEFYEANNLNMRKLFNIADENILESVLAGLKRTDVDKYNEVVNIYTKSSDLFTVYLPSKVDAISSTISDYTKKLEKDLNDKVSERVIKELKTYLEKFASLYAYMLSTIDKVKEVQRVITLKVETFTFEEAIKEFKSK